MKHKWKGLLLSAVIGAAAVVFGTACGASRELKALEGHWVDVNGSSTLDFSGNTMTFTSWDTPEKYTVKVEDKQVKNAKGNGDGFGLMGNLDICQDGSLRGYEQILDAEGHTYYFVREEEKAALLEIKDNSRNLPKEITSNVIEDFELTFSKGARDEYGLGDGWPEGHYSWEIELEEDGSYEMELDCMGDSYVAMRFKAKVDREYAEGLARLLQEMELPQLNGYDMSNAAHRHGYSLKVEYESGEELSIRAGGDAADTCVFDLPRLMAYAAKQDIFRH